MEKPLFQQIYCKNIIFNFKSVENSIYITFKIDKKSFDKNLSYVSDETFFCFITDIYNIF